MEQNDGDDSVQNTVEFIELDTKYLYCWGFGKYGQLGKKFINYSVEPIRQEIDEKEEIFAISAGESHSAFLTVTPIPMLYSFGKNYFGQLGLGRNFYSYLPAEVAISKTEKFTKISCGGDHTLALSEDGSLYAWGLNVFGQLGIGDFLARSTPTKIDLYSKNILPKSENIVDIAAGAQHSLILTNKNRIFSCGFSRNGSLGYETEEDTNIFRHIEGVKCKIQIEKIAAGVYHSGCILDSDILLIWGKGEYLQLDVPTPFVLNNSSITNSGTNAMFKYNSPTSPTKKPINSNMFKELKIGEDIIYALTKTDDLYAMGDNKYGQLANRTKEPRKVLEKIDGLKIKSLEVGYNFVIIITSDNKVFGWGNNEYGQLSLLTQNEYLEPTYLEEFTNAGVYKFACGGYHSMGLFNNKLASDSAKELFVDEKSLSKKDELIKSPKSKDNAINQLEMQEKYQNSLNAIKKSLKQSNLNSTIKKDFQNISEKVKFIEASKKRITDLENLLQNKDVLIKDLKLKEEELNKKIEDGSGKDVKKPQGKYPLATRGFDNNFEILLEEMELADKIGNGTFGDVIRGFWRKELVAIKFLKPDMISSEDNITAFVEECNMLKNLRHPNILLFMGASTRSPNFFIVTEFCENGNLFELLHQHRNVNLTWDEKRRIAVEVSLGMNYLHSFEPPILHRDLKSMNVLLDKNFQVKIADFGSTKFLDVQMTRQKGTFQWMAPEVIKGSSYTEKADVFSFAIILNELATRTPPYYGIDKKEVARNVANKSDYRPGITKYVPKEWTELMVKCWDQNPLRRPTFNEVIDSLTKMKFSK